MKILGISAFYHDAAASIICDGKIVAAVQEERFTRKKHDAAFPSNSIKFCLETAGCCIDELDAIVFYDKPLLKFERLLETYYSFSPRGLASFIKAMPVWIKQKLFLKKIIYQELKHIGVFDRKRLKLLFPEHHLSHAASAFYPSPFEQAAILTIDGVGEWATASISKGDGNQIQVIKEMHFPHSPGLLYSAFTYYCGFRVNSGEYKLMGLAPYGNKESAQCKRYIQVIKSDLVTIHEDGSIFLHQKYFRYATGLRMLNDAQWKNLMGFERRRPEAGIEQHHCDFALAAQLVIEEIVIKMAREARRVTGCRYLCMAGGVALNCVANAKLEESEIFEDIFIQPAAGDAGGALGAAYAAYHIYFKQSRMVQPGHDALSGSYLGPVYTNQEIISRLKNFKSAYTMYDDSTRTAEITAGLIEAGNVVGWFQGRMEFGPRALGARSILADARSNDMQRKLNAKIKFREGFRPFAPSVLAEYVHEYFDTDCKLPYMLKVKPLKQALRFALPEGYETWSVMDKLNFKRSRLPAVTHIDYTARIQTVHRDTNPVFWQLLHSFHQLTGCAVLINTSFNVRGEPIVNAPEDAYRCFMRTEMDYLVIGDLIFDKKEQPQWTQQTDSTQKFIDD